MPAIQYLGGRTEQILSGKIAAQCPVAAAGRGGRAVECTGLENRRPFTGLVSSNLTLSAKMWGFLNEFPSVELQVALKTGGE